MKVGRVAAACPAADESAIRHPDGFPCSCLDSSKLIAVRRVRHAPRPLPLWGEHDFGTWRRGRCVAANPRADCFPGQQSAAPFYLALRFSRAFVRLSRVIRLGDTKDLAVARW